MMLPLLELSTAQETVRRYGITLGDIRRRMEREQGMPVARSTITKIFNGERRPSLDMARGLSRVLGTTIDELYATLEEVRKAPALEQMSGGAGA